MNIITLGDKYILRFLKGPKMCKLTLNMIKLNALFTLISNQFLRAFCRLFETRLMLVKIIVSMGNNSFFIVTGKVYWTNFRVDK